MHACMYDVFVGWVGGCVSIGGTIRWSANLPFRAGLFVENLLNGWQAPAYHHADATIIDWPNLSNVISMDTRYFLLYHH